MRKGPPDKADPPDAASASCALRSETPYPLAGLGRGAVGGALHLATKVTRLALEAAAVAAEDLLAAALELAKAALRLRAVAVRARGFRDPVTGLQGRAER